ncbi:excinuclease Cho [Herbaspirillum sp. Sphag1AN]|uniref:endonuclease n=1 Tax=unclassified Herbaspirillum TaxID=2624150 RepID=UPI001610974D|nr:MULTISPECIES: endonuclease [unclassified Herbaspirillum]MBB3214058.1 excinuclease Cho [Herbaspirillum sp. Sphag1AN]MBB3247549.1 excinuclease Cho [Herbaspirillum sp. Sphag64]
MPRMTSASLDGQFIASEPFVYPSHIDAASLKQLPNKPGIYIFRGEQDAPLYIGKSIHLRSRVLTHLRNPDEARMLMQSRRIEFQRTAGDIGAQLLEAQLIKQLQPLHNKKLRRTRQMCALRLSPEGVPEIVFARDVDFATTANLFGVFGSHRAALQTLQELVGAHLLCGVVCGVETGRSGRPCFAHQLKRCHGACIGEESLADHGLRLRQALDSLRLIQWPFQRAMGIVEECDGWQQTHVIDHWMYLGSIDRKNRKLVLPKQRSFDIDTYRIIIKPYLEGQFVALDEGAFTLSRATRPRKVKSITSASATANMPPSAE